MVSEVIFASQAAWSDSDGVLLGFVFIGVALAAVAGVCCWAEVAGEDNRIWAQNLAFQQSLYLHLCFSNVGRAWYCSVSA